METEMLETSPASAQWTSAVSEWTDDDDRHAKHSSTRESRDRKPRDCPKLEALKQIYEQICAIRSSHARIVAENTAKRAEVCTVLMLLFLCTQVYHF